MEGSRTAYFSMLKKVTSRPTSISRINMILHGVPSWHHRQGDSIRNPHLLDDGNKLLKFDRIVMNPPFSLDDWGYDDLQKATPTNASNSACRLAITVTMPGSNKW